VIRFDLPEQIKSDTEESDIITGFKNYFDYLVTLSRKQIGIAIRRMLIHLCIALLALILWVLIISGNLDNQSLSFQALSSGLAVAIWVLLLTGLSRLLFRFQTQLKQIRLYKKIKESSIQFNYTDQGGQK
jgi:hypothetical protein